MSRSRILIVDDESDMRWVIRGVFEDADVEIAEAGNGREALNVIDEFDRLEGEFLETLNEQRGHIAALESAINAHAGDDARGSLANEPSVASEPTRAELASDEMWLLVPDDWVE